MAFAQSQQIFDKNIRTSLVSDLQNQLLTKLGWSRHKHTFVATYSRCWLGSLKCLNNIVHALGNCNILLSICFYIIESTVNWIFLDFFFSSVPWGVCCVNFSLMWCFLIPRCNKCPIHYRTNKRSNRRYWRQYDIFALCITHLLSVITITW